MKEKIHPRYVECTITCGCGNSFETRATVPQITVEICSACHPFYTGKQKFVDAAGRVEKFQKRHAWSAEQKEQLMTRKQAKKAGREKVLIGAPRARKRKQAEEEPAKKAAPKGGAKGDKPEAAKKDAPKKDAGAGGDKGAAGKSS